MTTSPPAELLGAQRPRLLSLPPRVSSAGEEAVELAASAGLHLDPWQSLVLEGALGERADGQWAAFEVGLVVARQNGKGAILEARELAGLFLLEEELILHSSHEFKDLDCDTPILTTNGWSTMGELTDQDEVYAPDGTPTKVLGAHDIIRTSDCYRVTFADGQSLVAGSGHLWEVTEVARNGKKERRVVTTDEIRRAGLVHTRRGRNGNRDRNIYQWQVDLPKALTNPPAELPIDPYLFGAWLGDGDTSGGRLTVGIEDLAWLTATLDGLGERYAVYEDKRTNGRVFTVSVYGLRVRLRDLGALGNKHIPAAYMLASEDQRRALLAGIMDTDGTTSAHQIAVTMVNEPLMASVASLIRSLGYRATLRTFRASLNGQDAGPMYRVQFAPNDVSPFRMPRKTAKIQRLKTSRSAYNAIVSIERVPTRPTRCITVAHESACYLAGTGFVPTHNTSIEGFRRIRSVVENNAAMAKRVAHIRTSHGDESIELKPTKAVITGANGRQVTRSRSPRLRFVARTSGSGRGFSGDVVILDEAFNLPDAVMSALMPTMSARPNPQLWYTSSAVNQDEHPNGVVLARLRDRGLKGDDPSLAYYEWSADDEAYRSDPLGVALDPAQWAAANPGLGIRISEEHIGREQRSMGSKSFQVERLTIGDWPATDEELTRVIPGDVWNALKDDASTVQDPVVFAADANPERSAAAIAVVGARPDGLVHGEVIDARDGVTWAPARLVELNKQWRPKAIVLDPSGPAGAWLPALEKAGMQTKSESNPDGVLVLITGREMAQACGGFYTAVTEDSEFRHIGQTPLDDALGGAKTRPLGDAWAWARRHSDINIAPLVAVTLAHYGHALYGHTAPPGAPNIW